MAGEVEKIFERLDVLKQEQRNLLAKAGEHERTATDLRAQAATIQVQVSTLFDFLESAGVDCPVPEPVVATPEPDESWHDAADRMVENGPLELAAIHHTLEAWKYTVTYGSLSQFARRRVKAGVWTKVGRGRYARKEVLE